jgi:hypothetical protein
MVYSLKEQSFESQKHSKYIFQRNGNKKNLFIRILDFHVSDYL